MTACLVLLAPIGIAGGCVRVEPATDPGFVASNREPDAGPNRSASSRPDAKPADTPAPSDAPATAADAGGGSDLAAAGTDATIDLAVVVPADASGPADAAGPVADGAASPADAAAVTRGLVGYWPFDEGMGQVAGDVSGRGNQATLHNGAAWKPSAVLPARTGNFAVELDGTDDYLSVTPAQLPRLEAAKSVAFWITVRADAPAEMGSTQRTCVALLEASQAGGLQIGLDRNRPAAWLLGQNQGLVAAPAVPPAGPHHWAYTFDGTTHRLYIDGRAVATKASKPPAVVLNALLIGTYEVPNEMCAGQLDELRIFDRALTDAEVAQLAR